MLLSRGARLGPYDIVAAIGAGGMGEVYRAHDTTLGRDVAIKVLPAAVSSDPDRLARFEREARLLAALNHQNIAAIYGIENSSAVRALVLELVDGPTLADRITEGPIPLAEAVPIARQIADALNAAHAQGIVHRDLKPANIKLRPDGAVKVLDFGLAKLVEGGEASGVHAASRELSQSPTITSPAMVTNVGVILGTAAYMSPEQAKGQQADTRSDIWAFGCVLFEMLTGRRAFESQDVTETVAFVLTRDPDWSVLPPEVPPAIRTLLTHCLQRERRRRIGDAAVLQFVLDEAANLSVATVQGPTFSDRKARGTMWAIVALVVGIAVVATAAYRSRPVAPAKAFTFSILPPEGTMFATVSQAGAPALSPDGKQVAFVADGKAGRLVWLQSVDAFDARPLPGTEGAGGLFWSPDGAWLGFIAGQSLKKVSVIGGQPQVIARGGIPAGTWNRTGTILFHGGRNSTLASTSASGGEVVQATERNIALFDENHFSPVFLPDGQHYLLLVRGGPELQFQVWVGDLGSNERRLLLKDVTNAQYAPPRSDGPGHLVYVRDRRLMAQPFDTEKLTLAGAAMTIAEGVAVSGGGGVGDFTTSANGVLAYRRTELGKEELASYDRTGNQTGTVGDRTGHPRNNLRVSPDGKWAAFTRAGDAVQDVWITDLGRGGISRFTFDGGRAPVWSPDGSQLAFLRQDTIYRKAFGGGAEVPLWSGPGIMSLNDWSGDGMYLLLTRWDTTKPGVSGRGLWLLPDPLGNAGNRTPALFEPDALHGQFGPKTGPARWVAFDAVDGATRQVFVRAMPGGQQGKWQISSNGGNTSRWRGDGRELFVLGSGFMLAVDIDASGSFHASAPRTLFRAPSAFGAAAGQYAHGWDVTPDGRQFLTTFPGPDTPAQAITVVLNWQSTLIKQR